MHLSYSAMPSKTCGRMGSSARGGSAACRCGSDGLFIVLLLFQGEVLHAVGERARHPPAADEREGENGEEDREADDGQRGLPFFNEESAKHHGGSVGWVDGRELRHH